MIYTYQRSETLTSVYFFLLQFVSIFFPMLYYQYNLLIWSGLFVAEITEYAIESRYLAEDSLLTPNETSYVKNRRFLPILALGTAIIALLADAIDPAAHALTHANVEVGMVIFSMGMIAYFGVRALSELTNCIYISYYASDSDISVRGAVIINFINFLLYGAMTSLCVINAINPMHLVVYSSLMMLSALALFVTRQCERKMTQWYLDSTSARTFLDTKAREAGQNDGVAMTPVPAVAARDAVASRLLQPVSRPASQHHSSFKPGGLSNRSFAL